MFYSFISLFALTVIGVQCFPDSTDDKASLVVNVSDDDGHKYHLMEGDIAVPMTRDKEVTSDVASASNGLDQTNGKSVKVEKKKLEKYAISDNFRIWPNGVIPYTIDTSLWSSKSGIIKAMRHIESKTCIRFVPARKNERDYLRIYRGGEEGKDPCRSGGGQAVSLGNRCLIRGVILHELVHSIGFYHQQTRSDRDKYLKIIWSNIDPSFVDQFRRKAPQQNRILRPFDYDSIMLYGPKLFSRNGRDTMIPIRKGVRLLDTGVKNGLSDEDATSINLLYGCHDIVEKDESENSHEKEGKVNNSGDREANETHDVEGKCKKCRFTPTPTRRPPRPSSSSTLSPDVNYHVSTRRRATGSDGKRFWSRRDWDTKSNRRAITSTTTTAGTAATEVTTSSPVRRTMTIGRRVEDGRVTRSPVGIHSYRGEGKEGNTLRKVYRQYEGEAKREKNIAPSRDEKKRDRLGERRRATKAT